MKTNLTKQLFLSLLLLTLSVTVNGQTLTNIFGAVRDADNGKKLAHVSIMATGSNVATVTNEDGEFLIKVPKQTLTLTISHVGYKTTIVPVPANNEELQINISRTAVMLNEVVVSPEYPFQLVKRAIAKIPNNYSQKPELFKGFYRETTMKGRRFIYVSEGILDMYKTSYDESVNSDNVSIIKGRRLVSTKDADTLGAKLQGGPVIPLMMDIVKNKEMLFNEEELSNYSWQMDAPVTINNRRHEVVRFAPNRVTPFALYYGKLFIDSETLAFSRVELDLDMENSDKASRFMLYSKPVGVRFRPKELKTIINYQTTDGITRISYIRSQMRFNCDWKRKLFHSGYEVVSEMVVTDQAAEAVRIKGRDSFSARDSYYDKVNYFNDPLFWENYNIIEPTISLEKAVGKLRKSVAKSME
jgi:hypothetical protein